MMPLSNIAALELGIPPLLVQHILQHQGDGSGIDVPSLNRRWSAMEEVGVTTCLIVKQLAEGQSSIRRLPSPGLYSLGPDGLHCGSEALHVADLLHQPGRALWSPETQGGSIQPQDILGRLLVRDQITDGPVLNAKGQAWVKAIRGAIVYGE
jgi:hypothetical protein